MEKYIVDSVKDNKLPLFDFEKEYVEQHQLLSDDVTDVEKVFHTDVLERCNKETEELIETETPEFLKEPIVYLKNHPIEFVYAESSLFELIRIDAVALEFDSAFETYTVLFGLKLQKKYGDDIKTYLDTQLHRDKVKYNVNFSGADGLWEVNIALDSIDGFNEIQSFEESYNMIYRFVFKLIEAVDAAK